jgi:hypothetical protein
MTIRSMLIATLCAALLSGCATASYRDVMGDRGGGSPLFVPEVAR